NRRQFVQALGTGGVVLAGSAIAAACGPTPPAAAPAEKSAPAAQATTAPAAAAAKPTEAPKPAAAAQPTAAAAAAAKPAPAAATAGGDTVTLVFGSDVTSMDPHNHILREGIKLFYHMFDNLGVRDYESMKVKPWLATGWKS